MALGKQFACFVLFRLMLPLALFGATIVRFNGFSFTYGLLMLVGPLLHRPCPVSMKGRTGAYMITIVVLCSMILLSQIVFQAYLLINVTDTKPYGTILTNCSITERALRQLGLQRLEPNDFGNILRIVIPDIGLFMISLLVLIICRKLCSSGDGIASELQQHMPAQVRRRIHKHSSTIINFFGEFMVALFLAASGIATPCVFSAVYFLVFLAVATWWACYRSLGRKFAVIRILLLVYSGAHLIVFYLYQFQFFQDALAPDTLIARVLGLWGLVTTDCRKPWLLTFNANATWPMYVSPGVVLLLYFVLACEIRRWCQTMEEEDRPNPEYPRQTSHESEERQSLVDAADTTPSYNTMDQTSGSIAAPDTTLYGGDGQIRENHVDTEDDKDKDPHIRTPLESILVYIMKQSYIAMLITMMAWSITYHAWLTFVFLLAACIIWMIPSKRKVSLLVSPLVVCYAEALLTIQYVYGFQLTDQELPTETAKHYELKEIGLAKDPYACLRLGVQIIFTTFYWITLRQHMREVNVRRREFLNGTMLQPLQRSVSGGGERSSDARESSGREHSAVHVAKEHITLLTTAGEGIDIVDGQDSDAMKSFGIWVWHLCSKYWILVCAAMFLVMAVQEAVIYRIIYMVLFLYFVISFQLCYRWWRLSIYIFWWLVIVYSMVVLCLIYIYQFKNMPEYWHNATGISYQLLKDIGLEEFTTATLFIKLLTPTSFLIVIILQVHYFQKPFLRMSDINRYIRRQYSLPEAVTPETVSPDTEETLQSPTSEEGNTEDTTVEQKKWSERVAVWLKTAWDAANNFVDSLSVLIWRILEVHIIKVVMFTIFICCLIEVNAINVMFIIFLMIGVPIPQLRGVMSHLCQVWASLTILLKMAYQLGLVPYKELENTCESVTNLNESGDFPFPFNGTIENDKYIGIERTNDLANYLRLYIVMVLVLGFEAIVKIHQQQYYAPDNHVKPKQGIIFPEITRGEADRNLLNCVKFLANYFFFKFGLETCFIMTMVTMVVRLDAYSVLYGLSLGLLLALDRRKCYYLWPVYMVILTILLTLQYLSCLGVPPGLCWDYPWAQISLISENLKIFLYLPDFVDPPDPYKLIADFFQLLFVCLQWRVFCIERSSSSEEYGGGENRCVVSEVEQKSFTNPVQDFLSYKDSYLDYIKTGVFSYLFWVTLVIVFIAGTTRISFFCMGYLVGCFCFLWFGQELLLKPLSNVLRLWGILLGYNFFVILSKCGLQLVGCVYLSNLSESYCWLVQLFSIVCLKSGNYILANDNLISKEELAAQNKDDTSLKGCNLDEDEAGLTWDAICFVFLIIQMRVYKSHYFQHVVNELYIQNLMAARGAEIINTSLIAKVEQQKTKEQDVLESIKRKMERIKLRQQRLHQKTVLDSADHYVVIRSGDYYMFEDDSDEDTESMDPLDNTDEDQISEDDTDKGKVDPFQLLNTAFKEGTKEALSKAERQSSGDEPTRERRASERRISQTVQSDRTPSFSKDETPKDEVEGAAPSSPQGRLLLPSPTSPPPAPYPSKASTPVDPGKQVALTEDDGGEGGDLDAGSYQLINADETDDMPQEKESVCTRIGNNLKLAWVVIGGFLDYLISVLNDISFEYRSVIKILDKEKEEEKRKRRREIASSLSLSEAPPSPDPISIRPTRESSKLLRPTDITLDIGIDEAGPSGITNEEEDMDPLACMEKEKEFKSKMPRVFQLVNAVFDALMSRSEIVCYFTMILNHMVSASVLSLAYPVSVFLWAMLSVPRPTKTYWVTIITYTEAVIVVKYLFQFGFFPWNDGSIHDDPFWAPRIIGVEKKDKYAVFDLVLLFTVFIHRSVLKRHGLWKDAEESDTDVAHAKEVVTSRHNTPQHSPTIPALTYEENSFHESQEIKTDKSKKPGYFDTCFRPFREFYKQMTNPDFNAVTDVYAPMFLCDFILFFVIVFGYTSFGPASGMTEAMMKEKQEASGVVGSETVASVIKDDKVPVPFLVMLLAQFVLIIIDRALFLRKNVLGKFFFQIFLVVLVHAWMFFLLPAITDRSFSHNVAAQIWYFIKCIYFGLSAYQIRSGYPTRILGNFLTKKYNYINLFLFKGFLAIPFLLELRALMDWMWTDTTLALTSWLQMEDIYANIFILKCWRRAENAYPTPRGVKRKALIKYGMGGGLLFLLIFIIWFPLLLFSLANTVYEANPPLDCSLSIQFGSFTPIFGMSAQQQYLHPIGEYNYSKISSFYNQDVAATGFLSSYKVEDVYQAVINGESNSIWGISPPSLESLNKSLRSNASISITSTLSFTRDPKGGTTTETVVTQFTQILKATDPFYKDVRLKIADMINGTSDASDTVTLPHMFPRTLRVPANEKPEDAWALNMTWTNITFRLERSESQLQTWWSLQETRPTELFKENKPIGKNPDRMFNDITLILFNDRVAPSAFSFFTSYGILGLYISVILVIGRFVRLGSTGLVANIMFTHLPFVDRILKLCRDVYLVREAREYMIEEELFAKLVFLYRSPETLVKWTKHPNDEKEKIE